MKLLASDYDGTLRYEETVTEEDKEALKRWKEAGNLFVMDTGRSMQSAGMEADRNGIKPDYYITNNGGMVYDSSRRELSATYLDPVMSLDIMYIAKEIGGVVSYVVNDGYNRHRIIVDRELTEKRYPELEPDMEESKLMETGKYAQIVISMAETKGRPCSQRGSTIIFPIRSLPMPTSMRWMWSRKGSRRHRDLISYVNVRKYPWRIPIRSGMRTMISR